MLCGLTLRGYDFLVSCLGYGSDEGSVFLSVPLGQNAFGRLAYPTSQPDMRFGLGIRQRERLIAYPTTGAHIDIIRGHWKSKSGKEGWTAIAPVSSLEALARPVRLLVVC